MLHLEKSPTQEEYVRGHMTQNPYQASIIGALMRDVKNYICRQLDLTGEPLWLPSKASSSCLGQQYRF